jgi:hypothetical protein
MELSRVRHDPGPSRRLADACFTGALLPITFAVLFLSSGAEPISGLPSQIAVWIAAGIAWLVAVSLARRGSGDLRVVIAGAIALRMVAFSGPVGLSDDIYRYVWEGEVVLEGASPYAFAPASNQDPRVVALAERHPELLSRVNHPDVSAAYPPLSQAVGTAAASVVRAFDLRPEIAGVRILRAFHGLCDLLVLWPLVTLLRRAGKPAVLAVVWAWSPLATLEFAGSGHLDSPAILLLLTALAWLPPAVLSGPGRGQSHRSGLATLAWSAAILAKYLPLVALPWFLRGRGGARRVVLAAVLVTLGFAPFWFLAGGGSGIFTGLSQYAERWASTSLVHRWIEDGFDVWFPRDETWTDPRRFSRLVAGLAFLGYAWTVARRVRDPVTGCGRLLAAWLLLSPTLHPWYLAWVLPFLAFGSSAAWFWLLLVAPVLYVPLPRWLSEGVWSEPGWLWPAIAVPFFVLLARDGMALHRRRPRADVTVP